MSLWLICLPNNDAGPHDIFKVANLTLLSVVIGTSPKTKGRTRR